MRFPKDERPVLKGEAYKRLRRKACCRAGCQCEVCFAPTFEEDGHLHHINGRGMGGGKRDDSLESVQWLCFNCHHAIHNPKVVPPKFGVSPLAKASRTGLDPGEQRNTLQFTQRSRKWL